MLKNKILHVSKFYPPYKGGIEDVCCSIVNSLDSFSHKVICFNSMRKNHTSLDENGVEVIRVGAMSNCLSQPISFDFFFTLRKVMKTYNPDIVHLHVPNPFSSLMVLFILKKNVKLIVHWHSDIIEQKCSYWFFRPFERLLLKRADRVFVTSPNYREHSLPLADFYDKTVVIPNGISASKMKTPSDLEEKVLQIKSKYGQKKIVFFMGRHVSYKGLNLLIDSEPYIKEDCVILIAGNGPLTAKLKTMSKSDRIIFIGEIKDEEIHSYMTAASVLAFPSVAKNEAFGIVLAEAMFNRTPPVTFSIKGSGVNWVNVKDETGLEVKNGDVEAFGHAIDRILSDEALRQRLGENARQRIVENFTMEKVKTLINDVYNRLLENK